MTFSSDYNQNKKDLKTALRINESFDLICKDTVIGGKDAFKIFAGDAHKSRQTGTATDKDAFKAHGKKIVYRKDTTDDHIGLHLHAQRL